jgi:hypothetical protein
MCAYQFLEPCVEYNIIASRERWTTVMVVMGGWWAGGCGGEDGRFERREKREKEKVRNERRMSKKRFGL